MLLLLLFTFKHLETNAQRVIVSLPETGRAWPDERHRHGQVHPKVVRPVICQLLPGYGHRNAAPLELAHAGEIPRRKSVR